MHACPVAGAHWPQLEGIRLVLDGHKDGRGPIDDLNSRLRHGEHRFRIFVIRLSADLYENKHAGPERRVVLDLDPDSERTGFRIDAGSDMRHHARER
jgi:hypothetical protein